MSSSKVLVATDHVTAIVQDFGGDFVVVTFNEFGLTTSGDNFWGKDFFRRENISSIGVMTVKPNWYPEACMEKVIPAIKEAVGNRRVITYGFSQGGYGALKYSKKLGASVALAFSPQWSINPEDLEGKDNRFASYHVKSLRNGERIEQGDLCDYSVIFCDKKDSEDKFNLSKLSGMTGVHVVPVNFTLHSTIRLMTEGGGAIKLLRGCFGVSPMTTNEMRKVVRSCRAKSATYEVGILNHLIRRLSRSSKFLELMTDRANGEMKKFCTSLIFYSKGEYEKAKKSISAIADSGWASLNLMDAWLAVNKLGFIEAEFEIGKKLCDVHADNTWYRLHAVNTFIRISDNERALNELISLSKRDDIGQYFDHFSEFSIKLGRPDLVEDVLDVLPEERINSFHERLYEIFSRSGDRGGMLRQLMRLATLYAKDDKKLLEVTKKIIQIGEYRFALDILKQLEADSSDSYELPMLRIEAEIEISKPNALILLDEYLQVNNKDDKVFEKASFFYEKLNQPAKMLASVNKAISINSGNFGARHRLIHLLMSSGENRKAVHEMRALLRDASGDLSLMLQLGRRALACNDKKLALEFSSILMRNDAQDSHRMIFSITTNRLNENHETARDLLHKFLSWGVDTKSLPVTFWSELMNEVYYLGVNDVALSIANGIISSEPGNADARKIIASIDFLANNGISHDAGPADGVGLLSRIKKAILM